MIEYIKLMRFNQPAGFFLVFWPSSFGLLLGSSINIPWSLIFLFFVSSIIVRGAGCVVNDIVDRDFDKEVERTKGRPLAKGSISLFNAIICFVVLSLISFFVLLTLPRLAIYSGCFSVVLIVLYPFMKRITNYPQVFLSLVFNMGCAIGYFSMRSDISFEFILLYVACMFWTLGYDIVYGCQDKKYDKEVGVKSMSLLFEKNIKFIVSIMYGIMMCNLFFVGFLSGFTVASYLFLFFASLVLLWQVLTLDADNPQSCGYRFQSNIYVGSLIFISMLILRI